jgi:hypothetical protein
VPILQKWLSHEYVKVEYDEWCINIANQRDTIYAYHLGFCFLLLVSFTCALLLEADHIVRPSRPLYYCQLPRKLVNRVENFSQPGAASLGGNARHFNFQQICNNYWNFMMGFSLLYTYIAGPTVNSLIDLKVPTVLSKISRPQRLKRTYHQGAYQSAHQLVCTHAPRNPHGTHPFPWMLLLTKQSVHTATGTVLSTFSFSWQDRPTPDSTLVISLPCGRASTSQQNTLSASYWHRPSISFIFNIHKIFKIKRAYCIVTPLLQPKKIDLCFGQGWPQLSNMYAWSLFRVFFSISNERPSLFHCSCSKGFALINRDHAELLQVVARRGYSMQPANYVWV